MAEYRALPQIKVNDEKASGELAENLLQVIVEESLHRPSMFAIVVRNDYKSGAQNDDPWKSERQLNIGDKISIGFQPSVSKTEDGNSQNGKSSQSSQKAEAGAGELISGEITAIEAHFTETTQAPIILRGYDLSHRLHRGRFSRSFQNMTDSDVVKKIIQEVNLKPDKVDDSGEPHDYLFQENQTNMEFLRSRAARIGFELFVRDGKLNFCKPESEEDLKLTWLKDLRSFRVRVNSTEQVKEVEVRGWDYTTKKSVVSKVSSADKVLTSNDLRDEKKGTEINDELKQLKEDPKMIVVDRPIFKPKEADKMAQAVCDEIEGQYVIADAKAEGNPKIRPGTIVELEELGPYSGKYYVTDTRHTYAERLLTTEFSVRGLRSGDLLSTLAPPTQLRPGQTLLVGIVTDNEDPEGMGRVKVKFPTLTEDHNSNWARLVSIGAANSRGFDCLPEIDDEVLVAFEHGDIHRPYILGGVWNGEDAPPNPPEKNVQNGKVRLRTFQTRTGHKLQFVEEDQQEKAGVYLKTAGGHHLKMNDSSNSIELTTSNGHTLHLDDMTGQVSLESTGRITVTAPQMLELKSLGVVKVSAAQVMFTN